MPPASFVALSFKGRTLDSLSRNAGSSPADATKFAPASGDGRGFVNLKVEFDSRTGIQFGHTGQLKAVSDRVESHQTHNEPRTMW